MRKEYKFWITEKRMYQDELAREVRMQVGAVTWIVTGWGLCVHACPGTARHAGVSGPLPRGGVDRCELRSDQDGAGLF
jgi:hypothetical protein